MDEYIKLNGLSILNTTEGEVLEKIIYYVSINSKITLVYVNSFVFLEYLNNNNLFVSANIITIPDGVGIYKASRFIFGNQGLRERIVTTDLWYQLLKIADEKRYKIFFLGGSVEAASLLEKKIRTSYPNLIITGVIDRDSYNDFDTIRRLNESKSDILFIGLGTPLQEQWIHQNSERVNIPVQIAVGSALEFFSGNYKRAPLVLRKIGFEWFYRLLKEPKRLWKRYLIGIPVFVFKVIVFKVRLLMNKN